MGSLPFSAIVHGADSVNVSASPVLLVCGIIDLEAEELGVYLVHAPCQSYRARAASHSCVLMLTEDTTTVAGGSIDDLRAARVNLAAFIHNERQCDRNSDRENLGDLPVGIVRCYLRFPLKTSFAVTCVPPFASVNQPKELRIFACRLSRQHQLFAIGLLCGFRFASAKIPCHDVFVCCQTARKMLCWL